MKRQIEVAREVGVSPAHLSRFLSGKRRISMTVFLKIRDYFGIGMDDVNVDYVVRLKREDLKNGRKNRGKVRS